MPFNLESSGPQDLQSYILSRPDFRQDRLLSLYASFASLKVLNPDGYRANVTAWKSALSDAAERGLIPGSSDMLVLRTSPELVTAMANSRVGTPAGLGLVVDEAVKSKEWIPLDDFLKGSGGTGVLGWIGWGLGKVLGTGSTVNEEVVKEGNYVMVKAVDALARRVLAEYTARPRKIDRIFSLESLQEDVLSSLKIDMSETDTLVLATHLASSFNVSFDSSQSIVKFPARNSKAEPVTPEDATLLLIKTTLCKLDTLIGQLTSRQAQLQADARRYLSSNPPNKTMALSALRSSKLAESALKTQVNQQHSLEEVLNGIETAQGNLEMMQVMEKSDAVIRGLNKQIGGVDRVEEIMDAVREGMQDAAEINAVLHDTGAVIDEQEVEDELAELERQEKEKAERERIMEMPVPEPPRRTEVDRVREEEGKEVDSLTSSLSGLSVKEGEVDGEADREARKAPLPV